MKIELLILLPQLHKITEQSYELDDLIQVLLPDSVDENSAETMLNNFIIAVDCCSSNHMQTKGLNLFVCCGA